MGLIRARYWGSYPKSGKFYWGCCTLDLATNFISGICYYCCINYYNGFDKMRPNLKFFILTNKETIGHTLSWKCTITIQFLNIDIIRNSIDTISILYTRMLYNWK